jgi:hypothetical protein
MKSMKSIKMPKSMTNIKFKLLKFIAEMMTSKYFLIFLTGLSAINILGYLSMGYTDAVILFALISFITFIFSKNMSVVLLVSVVIVNLFMHSNLLEGVSVGGKTDDSQESGNYSPDVISLLESLTNMKDAEPDGDVETEEAEVETETTTKVIQEEEDDEEVVVKKKANTAEPFQPAVVKQHPHIDYGATLTDAYQNLEKMLGTGGLKNLTADTKQLMEQQSKLFNSMENIAPLLSQAQELMKKMDVTKFSGKVGGLADSAEPLGKSKS